MKEALATNETKVIDFKIAGVPYKIKTSALGFGSSFNAAGTKSEIDEESIQQLIQYVDAKVTEALKMTKNSSFQNAAVLACLNIAEEMMLLKRKVYADLDKLENKAVKLYQDLENTKSNKNLQIEEVQS